MSLSKVENISFHPALCIVIPYYKNDYINQTLDSISKQTDKRFTLYIGDDHSPHPLNLYSATFQNEFKNRIYHTRFTDNLGSQSLTKQWERCIALTKSEPYIWLFSDDDIIPPDAVERFYSFIAAKADVRLCRFNIKIIDEEGSVMREATPHPTFETAEQFIKRRLAGTCISTACEYIFSRKVYEEKKGFVDLPLAWAADDATWAFFAEETGIQTIPGTPVSWRMSGQNISSEMGSSYQKKMEASVLFVKLIGERFNVTNTEKFTWLQLQLRLLATPVQKKKEFYKYLQTNGLFSKYFILSFLCKQMVASLWKRAKQKIIKAIKT